MFSVKKQKRQQTTSALSSKSLSRSVKDSLPIRESLNSLYSLQRNLGNSYLQAISSMATNSDRLRIQRACASCSDSCANCATGENNLRKLQPKLIVGSPDDVYEQQADRVADEVMRMPEPKLQRQGELEEEEEEMVQRKIVPHLTPLNSESSSFETLSIIPEVLRSPGQPLAPETRAFMESRFEHDFSQVRVHTNAKATESARVLNALAYTVKRNIVFGAGQYEPETVTGKRLLAHELTHVVQQSSAVKTNFNNPGSNRGQKAFKQQADETAQYIVNANSSSIEIGKPHPGKGIKHFVTTSPVTHIQRQLVTPLAPGGGFGGLMERDQQATAALSSTPFHVCSRDLQGVLGLIGNHAYIEAPPFRYAIISPLCPNSWSDNPITGTTAQKWDNSPDPCGKTPNCVPCQPRPGITDVAQCLRDAFTSYASLSLYRGTGPNSNTFAGTLARTCCAGMIPKPSRLGNVPGWHDPSAPARAGGTPCPPGPTC